MRPSAFSSRLYIFLFRSLRDQSQLANTNRTKNSANQIALINVSLGPCEDRPRVGRGDMHATE